MSLKINYLKKINKKITSNVVLFVNENFKISSIKRFLTNIEFVAEGEQKSKSKDKNPIVIRSLRN